MLSLKTSLIMIEPGSDARDLGPGDPIAINAVIC